MNDAYQQTTPPRTLSPPPMTQSDGPLSTTVSSETKPSFGTDPASQPRSQLGLSTSLPIAERRQQVCRAASEVYRKNPAWIVFFREVLGVSGIVQRMFPDSNELLAFEQTAEYSEIQQMMAKLRERSKAPGDSIEPTRVITVRLPKSLHESLRAEAHQKHTSMNQLCISKLLQIIGSDLVPSD